jgi:phage terminase Nu1 subunit (DNA packaging protein)
LHGRIERACVYDRALDAQEVAASYASIPHEPSRRELLELLDAAEQARVAELEAAVQRLSVELEGLTVVTPSNFDVTLWTEVARALLAAKEFVFIK